jgi:SAM-dependent methyltransferase
MSQAAPWLPPSDSLEKRDGIWLPKAVSAVSYPEEGNSLCYQVEDTSYWFQHRNACLLELLRQRPPGGAFFDVGGGNGCVAAALQRGGHDVVVVEPGDGALNAVKRGVAHVVRAALHDAAFHDHSLPAMGAFDVIEHIEDDVGFLRLAHQLLMPGGRFYCSVPAHAALWSNEDVSAGHWRRYSRNSLEAAFRAAGFEVEFITSIFTWLTPPVMAFRAVPYRMREALKLRPPPLTSASVASAHHVPGFMSWAVERIHAWEVGRIRLGQEVPLPGTSLLCVARAPA